MKTKLKNLLPTHNITIHSETNLYIADYKNFNHGEVILITTKPQDIKSIYLNNSKPVTICFDGFKENALPISTGVYNRQCECVLFPNENDENTWILFVETKYTNDFKSAFKKENDYPNCMTKQIIETVKYFRENGIIDINKKVYAIVSFPNLIEEFNSTIFKGDLSIEDILRDYKIIIRGTNSAKIISEKRIKLNSE